ncbi:response regulator transcription factor [Pandoraea commovens]|uniref:LuxR family transcriptional regulator n=1 Tax=Pandoraea commovens TaxID=2508289 RepID=A0A5E4UZT5_9BURK|nr:response regulator transcription factor [Pandoraea commovens]UVA78555.1 response regulator transcription factor [Pandoraea commovens]VVE04864.1 LuxR family transcriptional regulator [Pandoraea commovens]
MTPIRVAIADHHPVVVAGLEHELGKRPSLEVLGTARHVAEIVDVLNRTSCDVLVIDHTMPGGKYGDGLSLLATLRRMFPCVRILVLTAMVDAPMARQITDLGVASTLCKSRGIDDVIAAVHALHDGLRPTRPTHLTRRTAPAGAVSDARTALLSQREVQVLRMYVSGMSITAIAAKLYRTKQTVSAQKRSVMRKLGVDCDAQLYRFALQTGLPDDGPLVSPERDVDAA